LLGPGTIGGEVGSGSLGGGRRTKQAKLGDLQTGKTKEWKI